MNNSFPFLTIALVWIGLIRGKGIASVQLDAACGSARAAASRATTEPSPGLGGLNTSTVYGTFHTTPNL